MSPIHAGGGEESFFWDAERGTTDGGTSSEKLNSLEEVLTLLDTPEANWFPLNLLCTPLAVSTTVHLADEEEGTARKASFLAILAQVAFLSNMFKRKSAATRAAVT